MNNHSKGWVLVNLHLTGDNQVIECKDFYNVKLINTGEVTALIGTLEIFPGMCEPIGLDWLPCAMDQIEFEWKDEPGKKSLTVTAARITEHCCP